MPVGAYLLRTTDPHILSRIIALLVALFALMLMTGWRHQGGNQLAPVLGVGAASGVLMAATSMGNPPVLLYMLSSRNSAAQNRANIIAYVGVTQIALLAVLASMGLLSWSPVERAAVLMPGYLLAAWIGSRLFRQSDESLYRRTTLIFLLCVGVYGLLH